MDFNVTCLLLIRQIKVIRRHKCYAQQSAYSICAMARKFPLGITFCVENMG